MVNLSKPKLTLLQQEILGLLFVKAGTVLNQRQIANLLNVTQPAVQKALPCLEKTKLIKVAQDKLTKRWAIELNRESARAMQLKRVDNLKQLYLSGLVDHLEEKFAGGTIVLFGSYSRGDDVINSDIDIAVIGRKDKEIKVSLYEKLLEREININFYPSFKEIHKNLLDNICNGIVLAGGIDL
ncbi:MAG: hypothetical protein GXP63_05865 [DPANN group archaeon]|nr:hypothetical protein [DPANN group archaeon]